MGIASSRQHNSSPENMPVTSKAGSELVKKLITDNSVMVFSKSYCPYSNNAKGLLTRNNIKFNAVELDIRNDGVDIQNHLAAISGQRTVPNVFVNGHHLGGCDDTIDAFGSSKFADLLNGPVGKFAETKETSKEGYPAPESPAPEDASPASSRSASQAVSDDKSPI